MPTAIILTVQLHCFSNNGRSTSNRPVSRGLVVVARMSSFAVRTPSVGVAGKEEAGRVVAGGTAVGSSVAGTTVEVAAAVVLVGPAWTTAGLLVEAGGVAVEAGGQANKTSTIRRIAVGILKNILLAGIFPHKQLYWCNYTDACCVRQTETRYYLPLSQNNLI
jgi:hypothetical protein